MEPHPHLQKLRAELVAATEAESRRARTGVVWLILLTTVGIVLGSLALLLFSWEPSLTINRGIPMEYAAFSLISLFTVWRLRRWSRNVADELVSDTDAKMDTYRNAVCNVLFANGYSGEVVSQNEPFHNPYRLLAAKDGRIANIKVSALPGAVLFTVDEVTSTLHPVSA